MRHLFQTCTATSNRQAIVGPAIGLGRGLNVPIVAEGVETKEQLGFLGREAAMGCKAI